MTAGPRPRGWPGVKVLMVLLTLPGALVPSAVGAHEAGTTRVVGSFAADGAYRFELTTDAGTLLARLELARKRPRSSPQSAVDLQRGFDALCGDIADHLTLRFDGGADQPHMVCQVDEPSGPILSDVNLLGVTVSLTGSVSAAVRTFQWRYDLTSTLYALSIRTDVTHSSDLVWLDGEQESGPLPATRWPPPPPPWRVGTASFRLGFAQVLPRGLLQIFFVFGLCLLAAHFRAALWMIGVFAAGHSTAFALIAGEGIAVPSDVVGPLVGLTLGCVGLANWRAQRSGVLLGWRLLAFTLLCGVVHGAATAVAIQGASLSSTDLGWTLSGLCMGSAAAELAVTLFGFWIIGGWASHRDTQGGRVTVPPTRSSSIWMFLIQHVIG